MLDAIYATDDAMYREIFAREELHHPITFRITARPDVFAPATVCAGRPYRIYRGDSNMLGTIVVLHFGPSGSRISVDAELEQPNPTPTPDGGFDSANYYTYYDGLAVERVDDHWRTVRPPQR